MFLTNQQLPSSNSSISFCRESFGEFHQSNNVRISGIQMNLSKTNHKPFQRTNSSSSSVSNSSPNSPTCPSPTCSNSSPIYNNNKSLVAPIPRKASITTIRNDRIPVNTNKISKSTNESSTNLDPSLLAGLEIQNILSNSANNNNGTRIKTQPISTINNNPRVLQNININSQTISRSPQQKSPSFNNNFSSNKLSICTNLTQTPHSTSSINNSVNMIDEEFFITPPARTENPLAFDQSFSKIEEYPIQLTTFDKSRASYEQ